MSLKTFAILIFACCDFFLLACALAFQPPPWLWIPPVVTIVMVQAAWLSNVWGRL